jgi:hypothetical protein
MVREIPDRQEEALLSIVLPKVLHVAELGRAIDDHIDVVTRVRNDGIVNDTTRLRGDQTETSGPFGEAANVADDNLFEKGDAVLSVPADLQEGGPRKRENI